MKLILLAFSFVTISTHASERRENFSILRPWYAAKISNHHTNGLKSCSAYTVADRRSARLEVYSQLNSSGRYIGPTVQILTEGHDPFFSASMTISGAEGRFEFTRIFPPGQKSEYMQSALIRFDDRVQAVRGLMKGSVAYVDFRDASGEVTHRVHFSLRNSTKIINDAFSECGLSID